MPSTKMDSLGCIYIYSYTQLYETLIIKKRGYLFERMWKGNRSDSREGG